MKPMFGAGSARPGSRAVWRKGFGMNRYGMRMRKHYESHRATELMALEDPKGYFETLGAGIEMEIDRLADQIAGPSDPAEGYLERLGRLTEARSTAEAEVLSFYMKPGLAARRPEARSPRSHPMG